MKQMDITIVGGGLAGMVAAIALARGGRQVAFVAPAAARVDGRTTALMDQSIRFLDRLALWDRIAPVAAALATMQIIDGTNRLLRAPTVAFHAAEIGLAAFGYNMPNRALLAALAEAVSTEGNIALIDAIATAIDIRDDGVTVTLGSGETVQSGFVVGADGRSSMVREAAGISVRTWAYPQSAMVLNFSHSLQHRNVSTEFHTESGPFTQVPLPGDRSSLVWVQTPADAAANAAKPLAELSLLVEARMQSLLGKVTVEDGVQVWPLSGMTAARFGKGRAALIGEAAHVFPPIGAQGLNLGLRDVIALREALVDASDPGGADVVAAYDRARTADVRLRTGAVDALNRTLLTDLMPADLLRGAGLLALSRLGPLRRLVMRQGLAGGIGR